MGKRKIKKVFVGGILINIYGNVLLVQRNYPSLKEIHLKWDFPHGIWNGDRLEKTAEDGVEKETGLVVKAVFPYNIDEFKIFENEGYSLIALLRCYQCAYRSGELKTNNSAIVNVRWVPKSKIPDYDFIEYAKPFIGQIAAQDRCHLDK